MINFTEVTINKADFSDFQEIIELYKQLWENWQYLDEEKLKTNFKEDLDASRKTYFTARKDNKIVGICSLLIKNNWHYLKIAEIEEFIIDTNYRNQGIGTRLLNEVTKFAKKENCFRIQLYSNIRRTETHKFYESKGFEKTPFFFTKKI